MTASCGTVVAATQTLSGDVKIEDGELLARQGDAYMEDVRRGLQWWFSARHASRGGRVAHGRDGCRRLPVRA